MERQRRKVFHASVWFFLQLQKVGVHILSFQYAGTPNAAFVVNVLDKFRGRIGGPFPQYDIIKRFLLLCGLSGWALARERFGLLYQAA